MSDEIVKLFSNAGPWALASAVLFAALCRFILLGFAQMNTVVDRNSATNKDTTATLAEVAKELAEMRVTVDGLPERLRAVVLEAQRKQ